MTTLRQRVPARTTSTGQGTSPKSTASITVSRATIEGVVTGASWGSTLTCDTFSGEIRAFTPLISSPSVSPSATSDVLTGVSVSLLSRTPRTSLISFD